MRIKTTLPTILLGYGLCAPLAVAPARTAEQAKPAAKEAEKKRHRVLGELPFSYDYQDTLAKARTNGRPIFAYFTFET
jgi:hypothetical protein